MNARATEKAYASESGVVISASDAGDHGNRIEISHEDGKITAYSHLGSFLVKYGEHVGLGQSIGVIVPTTGRSTRPHVGFEIIIDGKNVDPLLFLKGYNQQDDCEPKFLN